MRVLVTSTSFQDSAGRHQKLLKEFVGSGTLDYLRGPLTEEQLLDVTWNYDAVVCGDDAYTFKVLKIAKEHGLKILSKYGVGLDKVDLKATQELGIKVRNCRGVNQATVAEHVFALLLGYLKNLPQSLESTKAGGWKRYTGRELSEKVIGIIGLGGIGKEVAKLAKAFNMEVVAYDKYIDQEFVNKHNIKVASNLNTDLKDCDILTLHCNLNEESRSMINKDFFNKSTKEGVILVNTARAGLVEREALKEALNKELISAYLTDVWFEEPMLRDEPLKEYKNVWITPHVGSRTTENVEKQGLMAVENLIEEWKKL